MHCAIKLWHHVSSDPTLQLKQRSEIMVIETRTPPFSPLLVLIEISEGNFVLEFLVMERRILEEFLLVEHRVLALIFRSVGSWLRFCVFHSLWASLEFQGERPFFFFCGRQRLQNTSHN